jgi:hypothetical protein
MKNKEKKYLLSHYLIKESFELCEKPVILC